MSAPDVTVVFLCDPDLHKPAPDVVAVLREARDELARWGWGDFHYGDQPQEQRVVDMVAKIDAALAGITEEEALGPG